MGLALAVAWAGILGCPAVRAEFTLIDNFDAYLSGSAIDGHGQWHAEAGANVVAAGVTNDPTNPQNRVLGIGAGGYTSGTLGHRETTNTDANVRIAQNGYGTVFFRIAWNTGDIDFSIGMTDVANPISDLIFNSFTQFESQLAFSFADGFDQIAARDGGTFKTLTTDVTPLQWYNVWMVVDNWFDSTEVYIQGGSFETQTKLSSAGDSTFGFRNGISNNDLLTFFIATGRNLNNSPPDPLENIGPVYLDDVYVDRTAKNLINPVPEPSSLLLAAAGAMALVLGLGRSRK